MLNIEQEMMKEETVEAIKLYATGLEKSQKYREEVTRKDNEKEYVFIFQQHAHLNTWGQNDKKVTVDKESGYVRVYYQDIDGEDWAKSRFILVYGKGTYLPELLHTVKDDLAIKYRQDRERLKQEKEQLENELEQQKNRYLKQIEDLIEMQKLELSCSKLDRDSLQLKMNALKREKEEEIEQLKREMSVPLLSKLKKKLMA